MLGCTRVELGVQTIDDKILKKIDRGHNVAEVSRATKLLKDAGFKVDYHLMPNLPGATPKKDLENYKKVFADQNFCPDMVKIYPCAVIPGSKLWNIWNRGEYKPYSEKTLMELLLAIKVATPPYARISRLIRDIPSQSISAGNKITNLREYLQKELERRGLQCKCLRCREIGHAKSVDLKSKPKLFVTKYRASDGMEYFVSFEDAHRKIVYSFLRLRLPEKSDIAYIREVHTYGQMVELGERTKYIQHTGLGKKMIKKAEHIAKKSSVKKIYIISGIGVRNYYRKLGYGLKKTYMVKKI
jgi:elongator complex protein 3